MTDILALDIATTCGWARGLVGGEPTSGSLRFGNESKSSDVVFAGAMTWIERVLAGRPLPDIAMIEALLPPSVMQGQTNAAVYERLAGLHGIMRAVLRRAGVAEIAQADVGAVRAHFIGDRSLRRATAKRETIMRCRMLGWPAVDDNAADALALWSFGCSLVDPRLALRVTPMFGQRMTAE